MKVRPVCVSTLDMLQLFVSLGFYDMVDYLDSYQRIFGEYFLNAYGSFYSGKWIQIRSLFSCSFI